MTHHEIITTAFGWWMAAGCKTYGASGKEIASRIKPYAELLSDIEPETLKAACQCCANTCKDFPAVADVREAVAALREAQRALPEAKGRAHDDCALCYGTGWETWRWKNHSGRSVEAVERCRCTKGLEFPLAAERKQLPPAEFRELMDVAKGRGM